MIVVQAREHIAMRTLLLLPALCSLALGRAASIPADSTGLPGDHFSLHGALELFKGAADLEAFEKALNTESSQVNNLDLDANGEIDYVQVRTHADGDARVIVLQVALGKEDIQDIAVIELEKNGTEAAVLQIRGDEELYPESTIIEPSEENKDAGKARSGPSAPDAQVTVWVNVWAWPSVRWCYGPLWGGWRSPWYWGYYPPWWRPWRPVGWGLFWGYHRPYYGWYHPVHVCRVEHAHNIYAHRRSVSPTVVRQNANIRQQRNPTPTATGAKPQDRTVGRDKGSPVAQPTMRNTPQPTRSTRQPKGNTKPPARTSPTPSTGGSSRKK